MTTYQINRVWKDDDKPTIKLYGGLTLEEAQAHCKDPSTATSEYMDTYTAEPAPLSECCGAPVRTRDNNGESAEWHVCTDCGNRTELLDP